MGKRIDIYSVTLVKESAKIYDLEESTIRSPKDARDVAVRVFDMENLPSEHFVMLALSTKNKVIGAHTIFVGTLNSSVVHPREIFQRALLNNAAGILVFHNHPSGDSTPSSEDIEVTERLIDAGKLMGIQVLDHIIIGDNGRFTSLKDKGYV